MLGRHRAGGRDRARRSYLTAAAGENDQKRSRAVFEPNTVDATSLTRATLAHAGKRKGLNPAAAQRSLSRTGRLTSRIPPRWIPGRAHRKHRAIRRARKRIARGTSLLITTRKQDSPSPIDPPTVSDQLRVGLIANAQGWDMSSQTVLNETEPTGARLAGGRSSAGPRSSRRTTPGSGTVMTT